MSCHVMSCHVMSCHVMSCHVMSCHVMSCHVMSCHVMSCHVMSFSALKSALTLALFVPVISGHGVGARVCAQCMCTCFFGIVMAHASVPCDSRLHLRGLTVRLERQNKCAHLRSAHLISSRGLIRGISHRIWYPETSGRHARRHFRLVR